MAKGQGKIICVTSTKGGVGKTILTLLLAGVYADLKKRVLLVDMDLYGGSIALDLGVNPEKTIYQFADDFSNNRYHDFHEYTCQYNDYVDVMASPKDPRQGSKIDFKYVEMLLYNAKYKYDIVLVDTTHILNHTNVSVLDMADMICYVMTNDMMDLKNTKSFMAILKDIEKDNVCLVLNQAVNPELNYFSDFDIKNVIKKDVDFVLPRSLHIHSLMSYLYEGSLLYDHKNLNLVARKDMHVVRELASRLMGE